MKQGKGPFFWVGLGCCGCLALVGAFLAALFGVAFFATRDVVQTVRSQIAEVKAGQFDAAYARLSEQTRAKVSKEAFQAYVTSQPTLAQNADSTFTQRSVENNRAKVSGSLASTTGQKAAVVFELVKEGTWKISTIVVDGKSLLDAGSLSTVLTIETAGLEKQRHRNEIGVKIRVLVSGFAVRPSGDAFVKDLWLDVETVAPSGERADQLSKDALEKDDGRTSLAQGAVAEFTVSFTMDASAPEGTYRVRLTVRDEVGGQKKTHEVTFDLP